jgi:hypothetical protein
LQIRVGAACFRTAVRAAGSVESGSSPATTFLFELKRNLPIASIVLVFRKYRDVFGGVAKSEHLAPIRSRMIGS